MAMLAKRARYWCVNDTGRCPHALADTPFSQAQFDVWRGVCGGVDNVPGCGKQLAIGAPHDPRPRAMAIGAVLLVVGMPLTWVVRTQVFPPPLEHIAFLETQTRANDSQGKVVIDVVRDSALGQRAEIIMRTVDGSAKAGQDYRPVSSSLVFQPGEQRKSVPVALLPDPTQMKAERHFELVLNNVVGEPRHLVVIAPKTVDRSQQLQAEQAVMAASRIAVDIAQYVVTRDLTDELMSGSRSNAASFRLYKQQLAEIDGNLVRAREAYGRALSELQSYQPTFVLNTMDRVAADLARKSFVQQSLATGVMKRQFTELLAHKTMDLDQWVIDLGKTAPRLPGVGGNRPST